MSEVWRGVGYFQQASLTEFQQQICGKSYPFFTLTLVYLISTFSENSLNIKKRKKRDNNPLLPAIIVRQNLCMPEHRKLIGSPFISLVDSILSGTITVDIAFCFPNTMTYKVQILSLEDQIVICSKHFRRTTPTWAPSCLSIFALTCSQAIMQSEGDFLHRSRKTQWRSV